MHQQGSFIGKVTKFLKFFNKLGPDAKEFLRLDDNVHGEASIFSQSALDNKGKLI
jgi:hypothetical protein